MSDARDKGGPHLKYDLQEVGRVTIVQTVSDGDEDSLDSMHSLRQRQPRM